MEFLDEEVRPRIYFQSRVSSAPSTSHAVASSIDKLHFAICSLVSLALVLFAVFLFQSQVIQFLLFWVALSLLIGPLAPGSLTGGDIRVGKGEILHLPDPDPIQLEEPKTRQSNRRSKARKSENELLNAPMQFVEEVRSDKSEKKPANPISDTDKAMIFEEKEWTEEDFELLKRQMSKHPVGAPQRWELIAEAFRGRHGLDSVIKTAKSMSIKRAGGDSFAQFLKQRKPTDGRIEAQMEASIGESPVLAVPVEDVSSKKGGDLNWSSAEDLALLNALKAFTKDTSMRWEKIAAAVPGKSKAGCMKRVTELKRDFRSSKISET